MSRSFYRAGFLSLGNLSPAWRFVKSLIFNLNLKGYFSSFIFMLTGGLELTVYFPIRRLRQMTSDDGMLH